MNKKIKYIVLLILMFIIFIKIPYSFSMYSSLVEGNAIFNAATFISDSNISSNVTELLNSMEPGDIENYNFYIRNFDDNNRNEVNLTYSIEISKSDNIPINIELYKNGSTTNCLVNNICSNNTLGFTSNETDNYTLRLIWDSNDNSYEYSNLTDYVDINISSEQFIGGE